MTIPFKHIPDNLRTPLFYTELDPSRANTAPPTARTLLIGQRTAAATLAANAPAASLSLPDTRLAAGPGSILAAMVTAYRANDPTGDLWLLPVSDDGAAVAATGLVTITGATTAAGTISIYIAGTLVSVPIASGKNPMFISNAVAVAINATPDLPVSAGDGGGTVQLTALNKGECGNDIDVRVNYHGAAGGEATPAGLTITVTTPMSGGATNPSLTAALTSLQDVSFDTIVCSLTDSASLAAMAGLLNDSSGRWSWSSQVYGHCFVAKRATAGTLAAFATGQNNQHLTCVGYADSPSPPWIWAAAFAGAAAVSLRKDPGLPLQFVSVSGILPPPIPSRFGLSIRNNLLLQSGVATWTVDANGVVTIENLVTTYVINAQGQPDNSYLETETLYLLAYVLNRMSSMVQSKYSRVKLAADGVRLLPGANVVTPSVIRADLIACYRQLEAEGFVQNSAAFGAGLVVEKNASNPNRVDVLWPGTLVDGLRGFALLAQFRNS